MESTDLRPLALGKLLDRAFSLYRKNFWLFAGIMAIPSVFSIPFAVMFFTSQGGPAVGQTPTLAGSAGMLAVVGICFVFFLIAYSMAIGAATFAVSESYLGQDVTVRGSYKKAQGKILKIVGVSVVVILRAIGMGIVVGMGLGVVVLGGVLALRFLAASQPRPIVGVILGVALVLLYLAGVVLWMVWTLRYAVAIPALLLERLGVLASMRRSAQLTKGRRWQILLATLLCTVVANVGAIVFQGPFLVPIMFLTGGKPPFWLLFASSVAGAVGGALTGSLLMIVLVLCYYDTRIRKEAFDLQFMLSALDEPAPASPAGTVSPA